MTKYLAEVQDEIWKAFKLVCVMQGKDIKEGIPEALIEYTNNHASDQIRVNFEVVKDPKRNLLTFIYETELRTLISGIVKAKKRNAPKDFQDDLKDRLKKIVKQHPVIPQDLADEVLAVFKTL